MLADFLSEEKKIAYNLCVVQMFFFGTPADMDCAPLSVMAYDHYVAICNPLLYTVTMSRRVSIQLMDTAYTVNFMDMTIFIYFTTQLSFYNSNVINYFFCDLPPLLALSTSDITTTEIALTVCSYVVGSSVITVLLSYSYIITAILHMKSAAGRRKAFSTCASHLTALAIFYGTLFFMNFQPSSSYSMDTDKVAPVFYTVVIPMLNPLIYSLRNKYVNGALKKAVGTKLYSD